MRIDVLTLFPNLVEPYFQDSMMKLALEKGLFELKLHNIRDFTLDKHKKVDDSPYGGGAGMVMSCQPLFDAIRHVKEQNSGPVIYLSPTGRRFNQMKAEEMAESSSFILLCGRYEGIDQRVIETLVDEEISLGDFVLTGGEIAALALIDAVVRLIPGVLGAEESPHEDSFSPGMDRELEHPHYTKPAEFEGKKVPDVLISGDHAKIAAWRKENRKKITPA